MNTIFLNKTKNTKSLTQMTFPISLGSQLNGQIAINLLSSDYSNVIKDQQLNYASSTKFIDQINNFLIPYRLNKLHLFIQNVNIENEEYKKIKNSTSFLLRHIRQNQLNKQKHRLEFQESQFDSKMSSILDHSFSKFQKSLDKHIETDNTFQHTYNLKQLTKDQLLKKLQSFCIRKNFTQKLIINLLTAAIKLSELIDYSRKVHNLYGLFIKCIRNQTLKQNALTENVQSNESIQKVSLPVTFTSIHRSQTERKYSKGYTPSSGLQTQRETKANFTKTLQRWQQNSKSHRSLQQSKKIREDEIKLKPSFSKDLHSLKNIGTFTEIGQAKNKSKRHMTNYSIIKHISGFG